MTVSQTPVADVTENQASDRLVDEEDPMTFAEALQNSAFRNVVLDAVQRSDALSHSMLETLGVHLIGIMLSIAAGAANAIAFAKFKVYVSHVSGSSTAIGLRLEQEQKGDVPTPLELVLYFILGAMVAGLIIPGVTMKLGQARYEVVLFAVVATELVCWWHKLQNPEMLAAAMGLQNALVTSWSGAVLRTTHMTGTATDLGSSFGRMISRFVRRGCRVGEFSAEDWEQHMVDRKKFVLMNCLIISFIAGGVVGAEGYRALKLHSLLIPAGLTAILGIGHTIYTFMKKDEIVGEQVAEEIFAHELSGGVMAESPDPEKMQKFEEYLHGDRGGHSTVERMDQFIRQISNFSHSSVKPVNGDEQTDEDSKKPEGTGSARTLGSARKALTSMASFNVQTKGNTFFKWAHRKNNKNNKK